MGFEWVIRHQKKVLFILAVVLVVGWGMGTMIDRLLSSGRRSGGDVVSVRVNAEDVSPREFQRFMQEWKLVFGRELFDPASYGLDEKVVPPRQVVGAYLSLLKLARESAVVVSDDQVRDLKRSIYRRDKGPNAELKDRKEVNKWLRKMRISGVGLDRILREYLMVIEVQARLADALEPTELEIWDRYSAVNRAVRVKMAAFPIAPRLKDVEAPEENEIQIFYVLNQGKGRRFYNPPAVEVEYVEALFAKVEPTVTVTTEEMEKFYKEHADLYEITTGTGPDAKKETLRLVDVKPSIEAQLRRSKARTRALEVLNELKKTYEATPAKAEEPTADAEKPDATKKTAEPKSLEALVKARTDGVVVYHKTPPLKETALLDVPGLGPAGASSGGVVQMAFNLDATQRRLSPVMTTPEGMFLMRPASPPTPESIPELDKVREQVIVEVKKQKAFEKTLEAAQAFYDEVEKAGADAFDKLVGDKKLETEDTPFFINNFYDAGRPLVIDRFCPLELGEVYGPMGSAEEGKAVVVKVVEEREADRATYLAEREEQRFSALQTKVMNFRRTFFPKAILAFVDFEDVSMEAERAAEATSQTPTRATTAAPAPAPAPAPATTAADNE